MASGWKHDSQRHSLAAKGISTKYYASKLTSPQYQKWKQLVNMSPSEIKKFQSSEQGKAAGLSRSEAADEGVKSGQDSARAIVRMKERPKSEWTENDDAWAKRQINFITRMRGVRGSLYDEKGRPTRKHTALKIWGHDPTKDREYSSGRVLFGAGVGQ